MTTSAGSIWVQGMLEDPHDPPMDWTQVLYLRLTGQYDRIEGRGKTNDAEIILGWDHQAYFFIGRPHPGYPASITLFQHPISSAEWTTTPFDTGGMVLGRIVTTTEIPESSRAEIVHRWLHTDESYLPVKAKWIDEAFVAPHGYVEEERPSQLLVTEVDLPENSDYAWTWEGQLPARNYDPHPAQPLAAYITTGRRNQFQNWVRESGVLSPGDITAYMRTLARLVQETDSPVRAARDTLSEEEE